MSRNLLLILGILGIWFFVIRTKNAVKSEEKKEDSDTTKKDEKADLATTKTYTI